MGLSRLRPSRILSTTVIGVLDLNRLVCIASVELLRIPLRSTCPRPVPATIARNPMRFAALKHGYVVTADVLAYANTTVWVPGALCAYGDVWHDGEFSLNGVPQRARVYS